MVQSPFFAFTGRYQMCLRVDAAATGCGTCENTHLSVFVHIMKGPHDDVLEQLGHWPLKGTFTIELLNQFNSSDHYRSEVVFTAHQNGQRVMKGKRSSEGWEIQKFVSCDTLFHHGYYENDILRFRISYEHLNALHQVIPFSVKISNVSQWFKRSEDFVSSPFFACDGGYQMILRVIFTDNMVLHFLLHLIMPGDCPNITGKFVIESIDINSDINICFKGIFSPINPTIVGVDF